MENILEKILKKRPVSYAELHENNLISKDIVKAQAEKCWPTLQPTGITRRVNVIWKQVCNTLKPDPHDYIPNSVWKVTWDMYVASRNEKYPHIAGNSYPVDTTENVSLFETLGWVSAPNIVTATMFAQTMLGSRAHDTIHLARVGVGGWPKAIAFNKRHMEKFEKLLKSYRTNIAKKTWAIETVEHSISMLEMLEQHESKNDDDI